MTKIIDNYPKYLKAYLDIFEPLFRKAYETSEFNLIMSLLAIRGASDAGWEPFENTLDVFEEVYKQNRKFKYSLKTNMNLWLYTHLVECSEHYELLANLIKTIKGEDYIVANHVNKNFVNLKVEQKIDRLHSLARSTAFENISQPFREAFDSRFRNAISHADYSIKTDGRSGITIIDDDDFPKIYEHQEASDLINKAMALHVAIRTLRETYISHYQVSEVIPSSPTFGYGSPIDITLIVRKAHGVIGFRCIGGYDMGTPFETRLVRCMPYELKLIEKGVNELPRSRVDQANSIMKFLPANAARRLRSIAKLWVSRGR